MRQVIDTYTFSASAKTVSLDEYAALDLERLLLVVNATRNSVLYNFADSAIGAATVAGNTVTLTASTAGMADADALLIIYDAEVSDVSGATPPLSPSLAALAAQDGSLIAVTGQGRPRLLVGAPSQIALLREIRDELRALQAIIVSGLGVEGDWENALTDRHVGGLGD